MATRSEVLKLKYEAFQRFLHNVSHKDKFEALERLKLNSDTLIGFVNDYLIPNKEKLDDPTSDLMIRLGIKDIPENREKIKRYFMCFIELLS